jgi:aconitate hydratase 2/2-methylisocitrate dehydratase
MTFMIWGVSTCHDRTLLVFDFFHDVKELADKGNANARSVLQSWADAEWFTSRPKCPLRRS